MMMRQNIFMKNIRSKGKYDERKINKIKKKDLI